MMMSLRQTLLAIGKQPPIRIPSDLSIPEKSLRKFLKPYWTFNSVDLRPTISKMGLNIKEQIRGTCSVFASTFLLEYMVCKERQLEARTSPPWPIDQAVNSINFSEEYLNAVANIARKQTGNPDDIEVNPDGDNFWGCSIGYKGFGIVNEEWFPYKTSFDPNYIPDNELIEIGKAARFFNADLMVSQTPTSPGETPRGFSDQQISAILRHLDNNIPVAVGFLGADNISTIDWGDLKGIWNDIPDVNSKPWGHSVAIVGYSAGPVLPSGGYFIFRNSWGEEFADKGYGYFTFNYVRKFAFDAVVYDRSPRFLRDVTVVKEPFRVKLPPPSPIAIDMLKKLTKLMPS